MNLQDESQWLSNFIRVELDNEIKERVKNFAILWNLFETFTCNKNADIPKIMAAVDGLDAMEPITNIFTDTYLAYFGDRYFLNGQPTEHFQHLNITNVNYSAKVQMVLTRQETDPKEILKALLIIVYRYRNNLFHGEKNVAKLDGQIENFSFANNLIIDILDLLRKYYMVGQFNPLP